MLKRKGKEEIPLLHPAGRRRNTTSEMPSVVFRKDEPKGHIDASQRRVRFSPH